MTPLVLIVDDERPNLESLERIFAREGWRVTLAASGQEALEAVRRDRPDVVVTDLMMPGMGGGELLRAVKAIAPEIEVILVTAFGTVEGAVAAMKDGAYDFITKPVKRHAIVKAVRLAMERASLVAENRALRARLARFSGEPADGGMVGSAPAFRAALDTLRQVAPASATVLLLGESGTGKELAARLLHDLSPRSGAPFVPVNCAAIPETILESELFGYERGAFTGATQRKEGRFQRAHGGTLFLDEVGDMSPGVQAKLLRVLQDGVVERLGGTQPVQVDVRIVAATNRDLAAEVRAGRFREDLYYRLDVVTVRLPPLRERREDVPLLAAAFLRGFAERNRRPVTGFSDAALQALGVAELARRKPQQLSGGQAQRVALARSVLLEPRVLLADEPTASLDDASAADAVGLLLQTARSHGATLVIATHDARVAGLLAAASHQPNSFQTLALGPAPQAVR